MKKLLILLIAGTLAGLTSYAQDISKGTIVKILEIAKSDSYYEERAEFLGKSATALGAVTKNSDGFYSGTLEVENGRTCFFKSVKVSVVDANKRTFESSALFSGSTIPKGTRFKILEVPSDDAYYSDRKTIEGKMGTTSASFSIDSDGYTSGSLSTDDGSSYYFYKVRLGKGTGSAPASSSSKTPKYVTGTISMGTSVYVADISPEDSYYSDRDKYIGKRGKVTKSSMTMKDDGYYAGDFAYDDGSTAYFYKAKFSKEPVDKVTVASTTTSTVSYTEWDDARNDDDIYEGDRVEITAVSPDDSYYDEADKYVGKKGTMGDDLEYDDLEDGYGGTIKLDDGDNPYFYLVRLKKLGSGTSTSSSTSASTSKSSSTLSKGTRLVVTDIDSADSFFSSKSKYIGKIGKVADTMNLQGSEHYSGKILFDDGTDAYFYKVKVTILK